MRFGWLVMALALATAAHAGDTIPAPPGGFDLPVSARSLGMGGAGGAAAWGEAPDVWANPALVTATRGLSWEAVSMDPDPGGTNDVHWGGWSGTASAWGFGAQIRRHRLEPGAGGDDTRVDAWAAGVSLAGLADALRGRSRWRGGIAPRGDLAFGIEQSRTRAPFAGGDLEGDLHGWGVLARWTPLDLRRGDRPGGGHQIDLTLAHAAHNDGHDALQNSSFVLVQPRVQREAVGVHYAYRRPHGEGLTGTIGSLFNAGLDPMFDLGLVWDVEHAPGLEVHRCGVEATFARVLTVRTGYVDGTPEARDGATLGGGIALPVGPAFSACWDVSSEPAVSDLFSASSERRTSNTFHVQFDPLTWRSTGGRP